MRRGTARLAYAAAARAGVPATGDVIDLNLGSDRQVRRLAFVDVQDVIVWHDIARVEIGRRHRLPAGRLGPTLRRELERVDVRFVVASWIAATFGRHCHRVPNSHRGDRHVDAALGGLDAQDDIVRVERTLRPRVRQRVATVFGVRVVKQVIVVVEILDDGFLSPELRVGLTELPQHFIQSHELEMRPRRIGLKKRTRQTFQRLALLVLVRRRWHVARLVPLEVLRRRNVTSHRHLVNGTSPRSASTWDRSNCRPDPSAASSFRPTAGSDSIRTCSRLA